MKNADRPIPDLERRRFLRFKDNIFIFANLSSSPTERFKAFTKDISAGGLMFETEKNISKDNELELEMYQCMNSHKRVFFSVSVLARVVWTKEIDRENFEEGNNRYRIGIEFSEIKEEDRQRITKHVEEHALLEK